jgi:hypothetical protein
MEPDAPALRELLDILFELLQETPSASEAPSNLPIDKRTDVEE